MNPRSDERSALAIGLDWSTRITTIGLEFALPASLGFGLDRWLSTSPWLTVAGSMVGIVVGMAHMIRLASSLSQATNRPARTKKPDDEPGGPMGLDQHR